MPDPIAQESGFDQSLWDQTGVQHQQMWKAQAPIVQQQIDSSDPRTGLDYLKDIPTGMIGGVEGFTRSALGVADHVAEFFGGDLGDFETTPWNRVVTTKTWAGGLTEGITEFAIGQALVGGVVNGATSGMKLGKFALAAKKVGTAALTDFIAFDGRGERFSNIIEDHVLSNPITRYLSAKPDDNWAEARLKNALEGLGVGWVTDKFLHKLGIVKKAQGGVTPELLTEADELVKNSEHLRTLNSQIDAVAPNNFTPDQKRVGWAM